MIYKGKEYAFEVGDEVEINAGRLREGKGVINHIWTSGIIVNFGDFQAILPPDHLELIEETPAPKEKNIPLTDSLRYSACNTPAYKLKRSIKKLYEEMSELITAKNENYGDSFSKQYKKYGMVSIEMRLNDKFMRLEQLVKGEKDKVGESVEDTLKDIIGYATLALIELEGEK